MRVILLTGKGGVGKTSHAVATALGAAAHGHRVFLLSADPAHSLGDALGRRVGARPIDDRRGRGGAGRWPSSTNWIGPGRRSSAGSASCCARSTDEILAEELLVFPGLEELVALRAIREVEATRRLRRLRGRLRAHRRDAAHASLSGRAAHLHGELLRSGAPGRSTAAPLDGAGSRCGRDPEGRVLRGLRAARARRRRRAADPDRRRPDQRAARHQCGARRRRRDASLVRVPVSLRRRDRRGDGEPAAAGRGRGGFWRAGPSESAGSWSRSKRPSRPAVARPSIPDELRGIEDLAASGPGRLRGSRSRRPVHARSPASACASTSAAPASRSTSPASPRKRSR